jgi:hypothetical protein
MKYSQNPYLMKLVQDIMKIVNNGNFPQFWKIHAPVDVSEKHGNLRQKGLQMKSIFQHIKMSSFKN